MPSCLGFTPWAALPPSGHGRDCMPAPKTRPPGPSSVHSPWSPGQTLPPPGGARTPPLPESPVWVPGICSPALSPHPEYPSTLCQPLALSVGVTPRVGLLGDRLSRGGTVWPQLEDEGAPTTELGVSWGQVWGHGQGGPDGQRRHRPALQCGVHGPAGSWSPWGPQCPPHPCTPPSRRLLSPAGPAPRGGAAP